MDGHLLLSVKNCDKIRNIGMSKSLQLDEDEPSRQINLIVFR